MTYLSSIKQSKNNKWKINGFSMGFQCIFVNDEFSIYFVSSKFNWCILICISIHFQMCFNRLSPCIYCILTGDSMVFLGRQHRLPLLWNLGNWKTNGVPIVRNKLQKYWKFIGILFCKGCKWTHFCQMIWNKHTLKWNM